MDFTQAVSLDVVLCDGAMGTELYKRGLQSGVPPEWWNLERPDEVRSIHSAYIAAGARAILTNTFGANCLKLRGRNQYAVQELNRAGVEIARRAAGNSQVLILGDISATGQDERLLPLTGQRDVEMASQEVYAAFREQAVALNSAGADAIIVETISCLAEAELAVKAVRENTPLSVICTMPFGTPNPSRPTEFRTSWGATISEAVDVLARAGASVVGANCGDIIDRMPELARQFRQATPLPMAFKMNAGRPRLENGKTIYPLSPGEFAEILCAVVGEGAQFVGGCCGSNPQHIAMTATRLGRR